MKIALQIFGEFRCFEKCLPDILHFIDYSNHEFDVFILTQRNSKSYSIENLNKIKNILGEQNIKDLKYFEDYSQEIHTQEDKLVKNYFNLYQKFCKCINGLAANSFVTRLWYRRYLNNQMRIVWEKVNNIEYDYVIRARFDIGFINEKKVFDYSTMPYFSFDILSIAPPEIINIESNLGLEFPFTPKYMYDQNLNVIYDKPYIKEAIELGCEQPKWIFMSENNQRLFLIVKLNNECGATAHDFTIYR